MWGVGTTILVLIGLITTPAALQSSIAKSQMLPTDVSPPLLHDSSVPNENWSAQFATSKGHAIAIMTLFANHLDRELSYTVIAEVRDENGVTTFLQWQSAVAPAAGDLNAIRPRITFTWQPTEAGIYEVRNFAITNFTQPEMLSYVKTGHAEIT